MFVLPYCLTRHRHLSQKGSLKTLKVFVFKYKKVLYISNNFIKISHFSTGDLFEREEDIADPTIWKYIAGSENPALQEKHRNEVLLLADYIIPGHGPMFKVTKHMKEAAKVSVGGSNN